MAEKEISVEAIEKSLHELLQEVSAGSTEVMTRFAAVQEERAARLAGARDRLQKCLGKDHPRAAALAGEAEHAGQLQSALSIEGEREARRPKPGPRDWMV